MEINEFGSALANPTRVRLISILSEDDYSASSAHKEYSKRFDDEKHRESIYRELENLVEYGLLTKEYRTEDKELQYSLRYERLEIDLIDSSINIIE